MNNVTLHISNRSFLITKDDFIKKSFQDQLNGIPSSVITELKEPYSDFEDYKFWLNPLGKFNLFIDEPILISNDKIKNIETIIKALDSFLSTFLDLFIQVNEYMRKHREGIRPLVDFSVFFNLSSSCLIVFVFDDIQSRDNYHDKIDKAQKWMYGLFEGKGTHKQEIDKAFKVDGKTTFMLFNQGTNMWEVADLLFNLGMEKMSRVKESLDSRFAKPEMMVKKSDLRAEITLPRNWVIENPDRSYMMNKPNDIGLYSSVANKALDRAKIIFAGMGKSGFADITVRDKEASDFFDYFEEIVQAIIMSYTTIECMANICIPFGYTFTQEKEDVKTTYAKRAIEKRFSLKDKLKIIIPDSLKIESPVKEPWWQLLVDLEELRNEIIHTKESKMEDRYSMYISDRIFGIASVHTVVLAHYAKELCRIKNSVMNDFPVGVGCDEIIPLVLSDKSFENLYNDLHRPSFNKK